MEKSKVILFVGIICIITFGLILAKTGLFSSMKTGPVFYHMFVKISNIAVLLIVIVILILFVSIFVSSKIIKTKQI